MVACAILVFAVLYIRFYNKQSEVLPPYPLDALPTSFGGFLGADNFSPVRDFYDHSADEWILRNYTRTPEDKPIRVFVGYWKSQNELKKVTAPRYTAGGWGYYWIKTKPVPFGSSTAGLREFLNEKGQEKELVYYCYILDKKVISDEYHLKFLSMVSSLFYGRNNAWVLRVSMPVTNEWTVEQAEKYEEEFISELIPLLQKYM